MGGNKKVVRKVGASSRTSQETKTAMEKNEKTHIHNTQNEHNFSKKITKMGPSHAK